MKYYYTTGDQSEVLGPASLEEIKALSLASPTQVCEEGKSEWHSLESLLPKYHSLPPLPKSAKSLPKIATTPVELTLPSLPMRTRPCPMCGEPIMPSAKKCKHCGEYMDGNSQQVSRIENKTDFTSTSKWAENMKEHLKTAWGLVIIVVLMWAYFTFSRNDTEQSYSPPTQSKRAPDIKALSKDKVSEKPEGNQVIAAASEGTSFQKEQVKQKSLGQTFEFSGTIDDVVSPKELRVMIGTWDHANVTFLNESVGKLEKGRFIKFTAKIAAFGSGILFKHDLVDAEFIR